MISIENILFVLYEAIVVFMVIRVIWVHKNRLKVLRCKGIFVHNSLTGFNVMLFKFWVWNVNKFIK